MSRTSESSLNVAFLGNSMIYFNDCPRILEGLLSCHQDSCLRGGASLTSLFREGNGMMKKFGPDHGAPMVKDLLQEREWDVVVINDHTQGPARLKTRKQSQRILQDQYIPLLSPKTRVLFIQTPAYKKPNMRNSEDLGDFDEFTRLVREGYQEYQTLLQSNNISCDIAPVGQALALLRNENPSLWEKLYSWDDFHPSPHGTLLQACILYVLITGKEAPEYNAQCWDSCRYMQPPDEDPLPRPSVEEAEELRKLAYRICTTSSL